MGKRLKAEDERNLVSQASHDPAAFHRLYEHYFPRVYAYVSYRAGRAQETEDLVTDIFLKVVEHIRTFESRGEGAFAAWLFRIARNMVNDFCRRNTQRDESIPLDDLPELKANTLLPSDTILQKEKFAHLRRSIGTLAPRRQEIVTLKFFGGLRNQEIAELLELDERTIASHLCRGLGELHRKYLDEFVHTQDSYKRRETPCKSTKN